MPQNQETGAAGNDFGHKYGPKNPVRVWREHRNLTVGALAQAAGLSQPYISEIEAGKRDSTVKTIAAIARALRVGLDDLTPIERAPAKSRRKPS